MLARSKLDSTENKISKAFINNEINHENFETIINEEKNYWELKESIRMMKSQRNDSEKKKTIWLKKVKEKALKKILDKMHKYKKMLSYCLKCKKIQKTLNPRVSKTSNNKTMLLSRCAICGSKKSRFIKEQEASGLSCS